MGFGAFFKTLGRWAVRAFGIARSSGLTDELIQRTLGLVRQAEQQFVDNAQRREWVVQMLVTAGVKESIARFAVEMAVQLLKGQ